MLSEKSADTVRATLPAVAAAIDDIADRFYDRLFTAHPELLRDLFNRGNQADGSQRRALAGSIAGFASALVQQPDFAPTAMLRRVAHKHASLGITRDQYDIVHTHLLAAIVDVLGDAVTEDVAEAWSEVYWLMAEALVEQEASLAAESAPWRDYRVTGRYRETDTAVTFHLRPADGSAAPDFSPGQYVSVQVPLTDGARQIRQYSLSGAPAEALQITVKKETGEPAGEVSHHLHDHVGEGDLLRASAPFGDVTLDDGEGPVLLISAGIGCTPMIGMLAHLAATGSARRVVAVHADRTPDTHALREDLHQLVDKLPDATAHVWYEEPDRGWPENRTGIVDLSTVDLPPASTAYVCGPRPFMHAVRDQLRRGGVAADDIHYEVFGPDLGA
ncbi:FAD-binding oxidoreductase [Saccharopolyspora tripterygii]